MMRTAQNKEDAMGSADPRDGGGEGTGNGPLVRVRAWLWLGLLAMAVSPAQAAAPERLADGVAVTLGARRLELRACREDVIRVTDAAPGPFFSRHSLMTVEGACRPTAFELRTRSDGFELVTSSLVARVTLPDGRVTFLDAKDRPLLAEKQGGGRSITPSEVMGEATAHVQAEFEPNAGEAFYGLGAHQGGLMNYAGRDLDLYQLNIVDVVPFLVSSRGYGLLWDNTSETKFGDLRDPVHVPAENLYDADGQRGGLTGTYRQGGCDTGSVVATRVDPQLAFGAPEDRPAISAIHNTPQVTNPQLEPKLAPGEACVTWDGEIEFEGPGPYDLMTFANNGVRVWLDGKLLFGTWRQGWLPWWDTARLTLASAHERHKLRVEWHRDEGEGTLRLKWKTPPRSPYTSLWSEVGDGIDYYFVYGPQLADVVAGYRKLTGKAPLMPRFALGFFQSRERYKTAREVIDTLAEFRRRGIPLDTIVMDWQYWRPDQWGSHQFDPERFPDPVGWIKEIHERWNAKLMISVWPKFYTTTDNFKAMQAKGYLYPETLKRPTTDWLGHVHTFYDAFNAGARQLFWKQVNEALFSKGIDAWWLDATEPELVGEGTRGALKAAMNPTALGSGARMANAYVLGSSEAVYEGQRAADPQKRVFILTRSAFAGSQRYAAATWSGDVSSDWDSLRRQVPAGLNMALSGIPWWTTDTGGFAPPRKWTRPDPRPEDLEDWRELFTRWYQYSTFCPILRAHGEFPYREMWYFGGDEHRAYRTQLAFDKLRYRMLPYTYSLAAAVTLHDALLMRPLVAEFQSDPEVLGIGDEFLLGPGLLVTPVTAPGVTEREVYLPRDPEQRAAGDGWYDFWTGAFRDAGQRLTAPAPYESLPVFVRAGSILPMGPELQYTSEKPADPLTVWVYTGRDGRFELYEDDGVSYEYEKGRYAIIPLEWDEAMGALTIGARTGSFPGMLDKRQIRVVFVGKGAPVPHSATPSVARTVEYDGKAVTIPRGQP
jgi:alpha-D-xyloside xylohydrolase